MEECELIRHDRENDWGSDSLLMEKHGFGFCRVYFLKEEPGVGYIEGLNVSEKFRYKGLGSLLLKECEKICIENFCPVVKLFCVKDSWVQEWYERIGFEFYADEPCDEHHKHFVWLQKKIDKSIFSIFVDINSQTLKKECENLGCEIEKPIIDACDGLIYDNNIIFESDFSFPSQIIAKDKDMFLKLIKFLKE